MTKEEILKLVEELVGEIQPVGATHIDEKRLLNLHKAMYIVDCLLFEINQVRPNKHRQEYSMKKAGEKADIFIKEIGESFEQ